MPAWASSTRNARAGRRITPPPDAHHLYSIDIKTERYEGYMKHAIILNPEHGTNIALMGNF